MSQESRAVMRGQLAPGNTQLGLSDQKQPTPEPIITFFSSFLKYHQGKNTNLKCTCFAVMRLASPCSFQTWCLPAPTRPQHAPGSTLPNFNITFTAFFKWEFLKFKNNFRKRLSWCGTKPHIWWDRDILEPFLCTWRLCGCHTSVNPETSETSKPALVEEKKKKRERALLPAVEGLEANHAGEMTHGTRYQTSCQHNLQANPCMGLGLSFPGQPMSFMIASSLVITLAGKPWIFIYSVFHNWALPGARPREWGGWRQRCLEFYILRGMKAQGTRGTAERLLIQPGSWGRGQDWPTEAPRESLQMGWIGQGEAVAVWNCTPCAKARRGGTCTF